MARAELLLVMYGIAAVFYVALYLRRRRAGWGVEGFCDREGEPEGGKHDEEERESSRGR
jgi:hypothetical protein